MRADAKVMALGALTMALAMALTAAWTGPAWALGGLVTPDGNGTITASRTIVVRGADDVRLITQIRYQGTPATAVWLIPLPNFNEPADDGVRATGYGQSAFDALDEATRPVLVGECDGMPTGAMQPILQAEQFGPANAMALPARFFTATEITMGNLDAYLGDVGVVADMAMQEAITRVVDENFMLAAVRIDTAAIGVNRIDPIVDLRYPLDPGGEIKIGLRPLAPSAGAGPADIVLWVLDDARTRAGVSTEELDFGAIRFISPSETDYLPAFDMQVGARQSQMFIYESAGPVAGDTFADADLSALIADSGAGFLTRLRARIIPAALRTNLAFVTLREAGTTAVERERVVEGYMCGGEVEPDMGPDPDMGDIEPDIGPDPGEDGGPLVPDGGVGGDDDDDDGGGGGSSGCLAAPGGAPAWPGLLLLTLCLCLPGLRRRG